MIRPLVGALAAALCLAEAAAGAERPFQPTPDAVDHVVTMAATNTIVGAGVSRSVPRGVRTIVHHGDWTRVVTAADGERPATVDHFGRSASVSVSLRTSEASAGGFRTLVVRRGPKIAGAGGLLRDPVRTQERRAVLGETCEVWAFYSPVVRGYAEHSCVTEDGIELWRGTAIDGVEVSSAEATRVERRPVDPDEVQPPSGLLDLASWMRPPAPAGLTSLVRASPRRDHEVVLTSDRAKFMGFGITQVRRRHRDWTHVETVYGDTHRVLDVRNDATGFRLNLVGWPPDGSETLAISDGPLPGDEATMRTGGKPTANFAMVSGEVCSVIDTAPGMKGGGAAQCRTWDGIVLKDMRWGPHFGETFRAVLVQRSGVGMAAILPPNILSRERWGLPR